MGRHSRPIEVGVKYFAVPLHKTKALSHRPRAFNRFTASH